MGLGSHGESGAPGALFCYRPPMIRLTRHAEEAVVKRNIALDWIERTVAMPDFAAIDPGDPT